MGHRALVAYRRQDGRFNLHYSHWGAEVETAGKITLATPFGGANDGGENVMAAAFTAMFAEAAGADSVAVADDIADPPDTPIRPDPMEIGVDIAGVMDELPNAWYEMAFVVDTQYDDDGEPTEMPVRAYRVEHDLNGDELLLEPRERMGGGYHDDSYQRGWYRGVKSQCSDLVENDVIDESVANERLLDAILEKRADSLDKTVLAHSPAIEPEHYEQYPGAFYKTSGRTRVLGEMYPTSIREPSEWELPGTFPAVKTADGERVELV